MRQIRDSCFTHTHPSDYLAQRAGNRATVVEQTAFPFAAYQELAIPRTLDVYRYDVTDSNSLGLRRVFCDNG